MLYSLLGNSGDAIKSEVSIHESNAVPQKLLECSLYKQATKSPKISSVIDAIRYNYASCDLSIAQFGSGDAYYLCRITMGAIRLSLTFDAETFINITATQSLDIEQMREAIEMAILNSYDISHGYFASRCSGEPNILEASISSIFSPEPTYNRDMEIPNISVITIPNIQLIVFVVFIILEGDLTYFIRTRCHKSNLPQIFPHTPNADELPRDPKNALERFIVGLK